ncbi:formin-like protein 16 [Cyclospora cayetanensis]|uniref:Formin-like protein 16 n=1 Tax=Cyclospora cayetanensis TaxID=88456 RepID=A0A6P6RVG0_9EIME|nr:formin-like protein 16 [Cyclospora cayetanensis]
MEHYRHMHREAPVPAIRIPELWLEFPELAAAHGLEQPPAEWRSDRILGSFPELWRSLHAARWPEIETQTLKRKPATRQAPVKPGTAPSAGTSAPLASQAESSKASMKPATTSPAWDLTASAAAAPDVVQGKAGFPGAPVKAAPQIALDKAVSPQETVQSAGAPASGKAPPPGGVKGPPAPGKAPPPDGVKGPPASGKAPPPGGVKGPPAPGKAPPPGGVKGPPASGKAPPPDGVKGPPAPGKAPPPGGVKGPPALGKKAMPPPKKA